MFKHTATNAKGRVRAPVATMMVGTMIATMMIVGCGESGGSDILVRAFGQEEARTGILAEQTADGFSVQFDHVILALEGFYARTTTGEDARLDPSPVLIELVPNAAEVFSFGGVDARRWDEVGYRSAPPPAGVRFANEVDAELADRMVSEGWSQVMAGTLVSPDGDEYPFEIGFPVEVTYQSCISGNDRTRGIVTPVSGTAEVELTWHLTHLFFDSFAEDSVLRVEPFAAVYDGTNPISLDDLRMQTLADIRGLDGEPLLDDMGNPVLYIPPPGGAETLREHVLAARFGHFNGLEGSCMTELTILD